MGSNININKTSNAFHRGNGKSSFDFTQVHNMVRLNDMKYICNGKNRGARVMVFDATFNNISVLSWWSVLLVEETGVPQKNNNDLSQVTDKLHHILLYRVHLIASVVIDTECVGSSKSNYHTITTASNLNQIMQSS